MSEKSSTESSDHLKPNLAQNLAEVRRRIDAACRRAGRSSDEVTLIAVSKTHPVEAIRALYDAGQRDFGESYVQEWQDKVSALRSEGEKYAELTWHFIGHLQSNKAKYLADEISLIHSVDRKSVMKRLQKRSNQPVEVLLQVNVGDQATKSGVGADEVLDLLKTAKNFPAIHVCGLMCIPPYVDDPEDNRGYFRQMREVFERARAWIREESDDASAGDAAVAGFKHLSMGMSGDFEVAIEEGATLVRVGTALFGERDYDV